ncbi:MAG: hypothetical protein H7Y03_09665 [Chitinophagaceae bacterium]|nr:hypothetical protein [Chitinophagaceae bacterium]
MYKIIAYLVTLCTLPAICLSQSRWSGLAGDGSWRNPLNWFSGNAPLLAPLEDILLDNSLLAESYTARISGGDSVIIHSLIIAPAPGKSITVIIDTSSKVSVALTVTSSDSGIIIRNGGGVINASRATDGVIIDLTDSLRVQNGGFYSHRTRRAHVSLVNKLSRREGTERGVFEFNIPSASNTLSLSNQVYGSLRLQSTEYASNSTYSGGAINPLEIRGDLEIDTGVTLSLNSSDTVSIRGNYLQYGGTFNIANSNRASCIMLYGDLIQSAGTITKTGAAIPSMIMNANRMQLLRLAGGITGEIDIKINNAFGVSLLSPVVIPYHLELVTGRVFTSLSNLLVLAAGGSILADSTDDGAYIDGPLRKEGLSGTDHFLFPVGKSSIHRWLALKNVTGNFTVEYMRADPRSVSNTLELGLDHISTLEYWLVAADIAPFPSGQVELSFDENSSGGVTDIVALRVAAYLNGSSWIEAGNTAATGSAGSSGSVRSISLALTGTDLRFTLGSNTPVQNPLPLKLLFFGAQGKQESVSLEWEISEAMVSGHFEVQRSQDGYVFSKVANVNAIGISKYEFDDIRPERPFKFYRLKIIEGSGSVFYSAVIRIDVKPDPFEFQSVNVRNGNIINCFIRSEERKRLRLELLDMSGRRIMVVNKQSLPGDTMVSFDSMVLPRGIYLVSISDEDNFTRIRQFLW